MYFQQNFRIDLKINKIKVRIIDFKRISRKQTKTYIYSIKFTFLIPKIHFRLSSNPHKIDTTLCLYSGYYAI